MARNVLTSATEHAANVTEAKAEALANQAAPTTILALARAEGAAHQAVSAAMRATDRSEWKSSVDAARTK